MDLKIYITEIQSAIEEAQSFQTSEWKNPRKFVCFISSIDNLKNLEIEWNVHGEQCLQRYVL